jgi:hypothetical protein
VYREKDGLCSIMRGEKVLARGLSDDDALAMAAAPELLSALKEAGEFIGRQNELLEGNNREWIDYCVSVHEKCVAAIAAAEGRA